MRHLFYLIILLINIPGYSFSQVSFEKKYSIQGNKETGYSILETANGFVVWTLSDDCGQCTSFECLSFIDSSGNLNNSKVFSKGTSDEIIGDLTSFSNGYVAPITYDHYNFITITREVSISRFDMAGNLLQETILQDTLLNLSCKKVVFDNSNFSYALCNGLAPSGILIYKIDPNGNIIWRKNLGIVPEFNTVNNVIEKQNKIFVVGDGMYNGVASTFFSQIDTSGTIDWTQHFSIADTLRGLFLAASDDGFIIAGQQFDSAGDAKIALLRTDSAGMPNWYKVINSNQKNFVKSIFIGNLGNILITGGKVDSLGSSKMLIVKIDSIGNEIWENTYCLPDFSGCFSSFGSSIIEASDNMIVACGEVENVQTFPNLYVIKTDSVGIVNSTQQLIPQVSPTIIQIENGLFQVLNIQTPFELIVFDLNGRKVFEEYNSLNFNLNNKPKAMYFYTLRTANGHYSGKFILI